MAAREVSIGFPFGGLSKNRGYQSSDPATTRDACNVTPDASTEARTRGGSRPGLTKRYQTPTDTQPLYMVRVSGGDDTRIYEYLVVGTTANIYLGQSMASGDVYPITYSESLAALTGDLGTEDDNTLITEASEVIIVDEFNLTGVDPDVTTQYQETVIIGSDGDTVDVDGTGSDGEISGTGVFSDGGTTDFAAKGVSAEEHYVEITAADDSDVALRTYAIVSVSTTTITLSPDPRISGTGTPTGNQTYAIRSAVRQLDPNTPAIAVLTPTGGFVPVGSDPGGTDAVVSYRDRLVWAIHRTWYMSRQGDPGDYDYAADPEDPARAIVGTAAGPGEPADPIVAMATAGYDYLIIFAEASTWIMRGDPGYGGQLYQASSTAGCVSVNAWCHADTTEIYFLGKDGLYLLKPNASGLEALSSIVLPRELRGLDRDNFFITLVYDPDDDTILIFAVPKDGSAGSHYIYDIATKSFWPFLITTNSYQPVNAVSFGGSPLRPRRAVFACLDGYIREWTGTTDDGMAIVSYVVLGPFAMFDSNDIEGILTEVVPIVDEGSGTVTLEVYVGSSAEDATDKAIAATSPSFTTTLTAGRSYTKRPRVRGSAFCIRLSASSTWAFEALFGKLAPAGKTRRI